MRMLMGLEAPDSGSINGIPESVSAVFQEDRLVEQLSVLDNIMLVLKSTEAAHTAAMSALSQLGLEAFAGTRASELSGGMQRRTALIRAVLCPSELLLLDEPFTGLDAGLVELSAEYILQKAHNRTVLIAGHIENELIKSNSTELSILRER